MSDHSENRSEAKPRGQDVLGLVLSGLGGLFAVSIFLALGDREPKEVVWTAPVVGLMSALGTWPSLVLSLGLAAVGTACFLAQRELAVGRHLLGVLGSSLGLSLLLGAFGPEAGGELGAALPGVLSGVSGKLVGAVIGMVVLLATVGSIWLSRGLALSESAAEADLRPEPTPTPSEPDDGVTAAEAAALVPEAPVGGLRGPSPETDVRRKGGVPSGTHPIVGSFPPPSHAAGEDEESAEEASWDRVFAASEAADTVEVTTQPIVPRKRVPVEEPPAVEEVGAARSPAPAPPTVPETEQELPQVPIPVVPSWERASRGPSIVPVEELAPEPVTEEPEAESEPKPVAALAAEPVIEEPEPATAEVAEVEEVVPEASAPEAAPEPVAADEDEDEDVPDGWSQSGLFDTEEAASTTVHEPEDAAAEAEEDPAETEEGEEEPDAAAEYEEDEEEEDEEYEEEDEEEPDAAAEYEEDEEEEDEEYEEEDEEEPDAAAEYEEGEEEEDEEYEEEDEEEPDAAAEYEEGEEEEDEEYEEEDEEEPDAAAEYEEGEEEEDEEYEDEEEEDEAAAELEPEHEAEEEVPAAESVEASSEEEPAKEIVPAVPAASAPAAKKAKKPAPGDLDELIYAAGCLILEQDRVAVSLLQRRFELDFDQACTVLDQLQEKGLIGPYMGGRTRDILLTREEWMALSSSA